MDTRSTRTPRSRSAAFNALAAGIVALGAAISLVSGRDTAGRTTAYDLMSYNGPAWFSPFNYCKAMPAATARRLTCPPGLSG